MNNLLSVLTQLSSNGNGPPAEVQAAADEMLKVMLERGLTYREARLASQLVERAVSHASEHEAGDHLRQTPFAARGCEAPPIPPPRPAMLRPRPTGLGEDTP